MSCTRTIQILPALLLAAACQTAGTGNIEVALSSARPAASDVTAALVVVKQIDFEVEGVGWVPVVTRPQTVDLLSLDGKSLTTLGVGSLPGGRVKGLRFLLDDAGAKVILKSGREAKLELPDSGVLKVKGAFHVGPCASGTVIVDFDPSLHSERNRRGDTEYELRCKARIKTVSTSGSCGGGTSDGGGASDGGGSDPCEGVVCAPGELCQAGVCVADPCAGVVCAPGERCVMGECVVGGADGGASNGGGSDGGTSGGGGGNGGGCHRR